MTAVLVAAAVAVASPPQIADVRVTNGSTPFAGDQRLLTTVSPNGDGFRDAALVHFRLTRPAVVQMDIIATNMVRAGKSGTKVVFSTKRRLRAGRNTLIWRPARSTQPRTYIVRIAAGGRVL